ncbi:hypothetical protein JCM5350_005586 [Sporobolomyces pararoseus]
MSTLHPSTLPLLSLISSIIPIVLEVQQPHLSHLFSQLLHQIYSPRQALPNSWKQWRKTFESREAGVEEKCDVLLDKVERTCTELLRNGIDAIQDWIHHDLLCLVSTEEDEPTELDQSPLLRTSPLGLFIRKTCLSIERTSFTEIWNWFESTKEWFQSSSIGNSPHSPPPVTSSFSVKQKPLSNPQALLLTALGYLQEGSYNLLLLSLEECFKISRSFGDKITLRGCWSLLKRIPEKYRKRFLNEVIGQTNSNDDKTDSKGKGKMFEGGEREEELSNPHDLLFQVYQTLLESDRDPRSSTSSLIRLFPKLYLAQILAISSTSYSNTSSSSNGPHNSIKASSSKGDKKNHPSNAPGGKWEIDLDCFEIELKFVQGELWDRLGISPISKVYQDLVLEDGEEEILRGDDVLEGVGPSSVNTARTVNQDLRLRVLLQRADQLSSQSDRDSTIQAMRLLLTSIETKEQRRKMGLDDRNNFSQWKRTLLDILRRDLTVFGSSTELGEAVQSFDSLLSTPTRTSPDLSPSVRLASNLSNTPHSPSSTLDSISRSIDLVLSRLEMTSCTSTAEALKGLEELEALESRVLVFSSAAFSPGSSSSTIGGRDGEAEEEEMEEKEEKERREEWGEMKRGRKPEAKFWETLARVKIVASDFDVDRSLSRSSSTKQEISRIYSLLESLSTHLSLSPTLSAGETGEWRRRSERYKGERESWEQEKVSEEGVGIDWRKVLEVVELVEEIL